MHGCHSQSLGKESNVGIALGFMTPVVLLLVIVIMGFIGWGNKVRFIYTIISVIAWLYMVLIMFPEVANNIELVVLTTAIVIAGAMAGGDWMSLLIKALKIPQSGRITLQVGSDGAVYIVDKYKLISEKYDESIVINEIPPHGRLIDADLLYEAIEEDFDGVCVYDVAPSEAISDMQRIIDYAPTVVEAEMSTE